MQARSLADGKSEQITKCIQGVIIIVCHRHDVHRESGEVKEIFSDFCCELYYYRIDNKPVIHGYYRIEFIL